MAELTFVRHSSGRGSKPQQQLSYGVIEGLQFAFGDEASELEGGFVASDGVKCEGLVTLS